MTTPKTALVTGAAVRVGRTIALSLANAGYRVAVHYNRSSQEAEQTVSDITSAGGVAASFQADLSRPVKSARELCDAVRSEFGSLEILVNNASLFEEGTLLETSEELWDRQHCVNLKAPFFLSREFVRGFNEETDGHIVNICDWRGERHPHGHDAYTLSKAGLFSMTRMLARELAPQFRVNGLHPGAVLAPPDADEDHDQRASRMIPLNRTGSPEDIARGVLYLLESPFVTGEILNITGGEHLT